LIPAAGFAVVAGAAASFLWDFTVDDALISVRYARHLATGAGWRFNLEGPPTDGVTPLPWPVVLAPLARGADALEVLLRAKVLGLLVWLLAACALGASVARANAPGWARSAAALALGVSVPIAAYAVSGMETALAMAFATGAALAHARPMAAAALAGAAASFRPELLPWTLALAAGYARGAGAARIARAVAVASTPFAACALVRLVAFGRPAPLALLAKPSDVSHGLVYAGAALLFAVTPVLACAPLAARRAGGPGAALLLAAAAHALAVVAVGGDWMPYARLMAPIAPSLAYAFVLLAPHAHPVWSGARALCALGFGVYALVFAAPAGRHVGRDRAALIRDARPYLAGARAVAALDVGWVGAATDATVIDCAGVTDPEIAALPGGHTSKRVDLPMLLARGADRVVLLAEPRGPDWEKATFARVAEVRLAQAPFFRERMGPVGFVRLGGGKMGYFIFEIAPIAMEPRREAPFSDGR
jgi:hypothetical protein